MLVEPPKAGGQAAQFTNSRPPPFTVTLTKNNEIPSKDGALRFETTVYGPALSVAFGRHPRVAPGTGVPRSTGVAKRCTMKQQRI